MEQMPQPHRSTSERQGDSQPTIWAMPSEVQALTDHLRELDKDEILKKGGMLQDALDKRDAEAE